LNENTAKQRMLAGDTAIGSLLLLGSPLAAETLAQMNFDFLIVDTQHGTWQEPDVVTAFRGILLGGVTPMARVRHNDFGLIGRMLDLGALGIVVPMVNSVADARAAAQAVRYPPRGLRSEGAMGAAFHGRDYRSRIDDEVFLAVQIESKQAVENVEEILEVDGVDGCWIGPADLAASMGVDLSTEEGRAAHTAAILTVLDACHRTGKIPGIACLTDVVGEWIDRGFRFVTAGYDVMYLHNGAENLLRLVTR
jgi:4-hydroxy-2-oxoheptanedioate aldolase